MKKVFKVINRAGARDYSAPRLVGEILREYFEESNEPLARAYRERSAVAKGAAKGLAEMDAEAAVMAEADTDAKEQGWHCDTELGCDLKSVLRRDGRMQTGKEYRGVLRRDSDAVVDRFLYRDAHFTFVETDAPRRVKRNPRVFDGEFITVTRWDDGSLHPNFKPMRVDEGCAVEGFARAVAGELLCALEGLVEK